MQQTIFGLTVVESPRDESPGCAVVYFVQAETGGPIKIGSSSAHGLTGRVSSLQTGNPARLVVRKTLRGLQHDERELHHRFRELRLAGEWFAPHSDLAGPVDAISGGSELDVAIAGARSAGHSEGWDEGWIEGVRSVGVEIAAMLLRDGDVRYGVIEHLRACVPGELAAG